MGREGIYRCQNCGNEFRAREGGGFSFSEYRCIDCDNIKELSDIQIVRHEDKPPEMIRTPREEQDVGVCEKCGGELREDIEPMCPVCKSREVEIIDVFRHYD